MAFPQAFDSSDATGQMPSPPGCYSRHPLAFPSCISLHVLPLIYWVPVNHGHHLIQFCGEVLAHMPGNSPCQMSIKGVDDWGQLKCPLRRANANLIMVSLA